MPERPVTPNVILFDPDRVFLDAYRAGRPGVPEVEAAMARIFSANARGVCLGCNRPLNGPTGHQWCAS